MAEMIISEQYKLAAELNQKIIVTAQLAQKHLYDMCVMLKQMRDDKLYKELGYANFEDYCENEIGMKRRNAYNYISIIEKVENVQSIAQIGMTKLSLLASLSESQQEEIQQAVNLEETSVRELKAEIDRLKEDNTKIRSAKISMESDLLNVKSNNRSLRHQLDDAEKKIADLESRPVEVAIQEDEEGKIAKVLVRELDRKLSEADQEHVNAMENQRKKYQEQINSLEEQLEKQKNIPTVKVPDVDAILTPCLHHLSSAMEMLIQSLEEINHPSLIKEAGKAVDDYRWKIDDVFDIFDDKFGN